MASQRKILFVYASNKVDQGSTNMRVHQLSQMLRPHLENDYELILSKIIIPPKFIRNSVLIKLSCIHWAKNIEKDAVLFISKACIKFFTPEIIDILKKQSVKLCFDHVDSDFSIGPQGNPDVHICSSYTQQNFINEYKVSNPSFTGDVGLLLHNFDKELLNFRASSLSKFNCAYIGTPSVGFLPDQAKNRLTIVEALGVLGMKSILPKLKNFNAHYALRLPQPTGSLLAKPFTKGFVAAACGAVVVTNRDTHDAVEVLGDDYPYLVNNLDTVETIEMLDKMKDDFGSQTWIGAQERMQHVYSLVSPQALAMQLRKFADEL